MGKVPTDFEQNIKELIRSTAHEFKQRRVFDDSTVDDLMQEFAARLVRKAKNHDPRRGNFHSFARRVLRNHAFNLAHAAMAKKRDARRIDPESKVDRLVSLDARDCPERLDLVIDVQSAIATLPPDLQVFAHALSRYRAPDVQRRLGLTREKFRQQQRLLQRHLSHLNFSQPI